MGKMAGRNVQRRDERASAFAADPSTQNQYSLHAIVLNEIVIYILLML